MLDLKAQLEAAGIVTAEQVKAFDEKEAKAKAARKAKAQQRKSGGGGGKGKGQGKQGKGPRNAGQGKGKARGQNKGGRGKNQGRCSADELKAMGKGEAYDRIRKIVAHSRLDDKERTIPLPDDQTFNFVTASGSIGRLYLNAETVASLREGKTAISSFMSNHGLSHCVLPKDIALDLAKVFPLWLRHLRGHEPIVEEPEEDASKGTSEAKPEEAQNDDTTASEAPAEVASAASDEAASAAGEESAGNETANDATATQDS